MSRANETLTVNLSYDNAIMAFRRASQMLGTIRELDNGCFQIKESDNGYSAFSLTRGVFGTGITTNKITNPATVEVSFEKISDYKTNIYIEASCFGFGPIQGNHCKSKLATVKSAILVAVDEYSVKFI